jgi:hypothetical protein
MTTELQLKMRDIVMEAIQQGQILENLAFINDVESIVDKGIAARTTNAQLIGSKKPNHEACQLTHAYKIQMDLRDRELMVDIETLPIFHSIFFNSVFRSFFQHSYE